MFQVEIGHLVEIHSRLIRGELSFHFYDPVNVYVCVITMVNGHMTR